MKNATSKTAIDELLKQDLEAAPSANPDQLAAITNAATQLQLALTSEADLLGKAAQQRAEVNRLTLQVLPALMDEAQIKQLGLDDGTTLTRQDDVFTSISKADQEAASEWLISQGFAALVRMGFYIAVDKGDTKLQKLIRTTLTKAKIGYEEQSSVHSATLRAFGKESVDEGRQLPPTIKIHIQPTVKLGAAKKKGK